MLATWLTLLFLVSLMALSLARTREAITPVAALAAPWVLGLGAILGRDLAPITWTMAGVLSIGSACLLLGETLAPPVSHHRSPAADSGTAGWLAEALYWLLLGVAVVGTGLKLNASYEHMGGNLEAMLVANAVRGAVTSGDLSFSPLSTALTSSMYVAAALGGFRCRERIRVRHFAHLLPAVVDAMATSGRGALLIVGMVTIVGVAVAWRGPRLRVMVSLGTASSAVIAFALALSFVIGRGDVDATLWEYVTGPVYGLQAYLQAAPASGIRGSSLLSALTAKLGGATYDAGDFVWLAPFAGNVSSGFRELLDDLGPSGLALFIPVGTVALSAHRRYRDRGGWGGYAMAISLYAYLGYFYYVSLGAFLPGWWVLFLSSLAAGLLSALVTGPAARRPDVRVSEP